MTSTPFDGRIDSHPLHKAIYDLCVEIEKLPASEQATVVVSMATALHEPVAKLIGHLEAVERALDGWREWAKRA